MIYCDHYKLCSYVPLTILSFLTALSAVLIASGNAIPQGTFRVCFERRIPHLYLNYQVLFSIFCAFAWGLFFFSSGNSSMHNMAHYSVSAVTL